MEILGVIFYVLEYQFMEIIDLLVNRGEKILLVIFFKSLLEVFYGILGLNGI